VALFQLSYGPVFRTIPEKEMKS